MSSPRVGVALALALSLAACGTVGGKAYVRANAAADRDYSAGRFLEAADAYENAAAIAERPRDKEESLYRAAESHERAGDVEGAIARYDALAKEDPKGDRAIRARYEASRLRLERGDEQAAYEGFTRVFTDAPEHGVARKALFTVVAHVEATHGKEGAIAFEEGLFPKFEKTRLGEEISFDLAKRHEEIGQAREALAGYLACAEKYPYPDGALFDDALMRASLLHERLGDPKAAIADCERLLAVRETSYAGGSYNRPLMAQARFRIAELQRDALGDKKAARASFHKVYTNHPTSILRPRALFEEAKLAREQGDADDACALATKLLDEFDWTRYAREADDVCPAVKGRADKLREARDERRRDRD